jgi:membrane fusion protein, multidrug efflux system
MRPGACTGPIPLLRMRFSALLVLAIATFAGCKKRGGAGGPPPGFATQVVAVKAGHQPVTEALSIVGSVLANEAVDIKSEVGGTVEKIHFEEGQRVEAGALLVELDAGKVGASLAQAEANLNLAQLKWDRVQDLLKTRAVSQQEADEGRSGFDSATANVQLFREQLKDTQIRAPFAGVLGERMVSPGQVIAAEQKLTFLADIDPVKVEGSVPERFLSRVAVGQKFVFHVAAYPGEDFEGEVYFIAPQIDAANRTGLVKARVANPDGKLKPGMFATVDLALEVKKDAVVIPEAALMPQGDTTMVVIVDADMKAQLVPVKPGIRTGGRVEILEGLKGGETVVVEGWQKTRPGGAVMLAPPDAASPYALKSRKESAE